MPRAKHKSAGAGRRRKKAAAKAGTSKAEAEIVTSTMNANAVAAPPPEEAATTEMPSSEPDRAAPALMLPDCLDSSAAAAIKEMLLAQRGDALVIDASQIRRVGVQSLQVLVAAARTWQSDGKSYRLENPSPEFLETIALVGLPREDLLLEGNR
ncbi:hypothetical protein HYPDE_38528 [Hyphomicrobium denitrificans 1NES1]|uniref:STAS domain-containing protein n=1 Tax=Hyphomicrobium denitrificans 1NES1 TaxID=670307 RepID=N0BGV5_9HYPH|nr:STAS domain-containing protein [Hyphomicrobium denitrificans]AGK59375.1 hypothetical protein HYPDE_38528 [Hyphomicrobium denitrificans 1NES1]